MMRYLLLAITVISLGVAELASADVAVEGTDQSSRIWTLGTITWIAGALASLPYWARLCYAAATTRPFYKPVIFCLFCSLLFCTFYTIGSLLESRSSQLVSPDPGRIASTSTLSDTIVDFTLFAVWIKEHIRIDISDLFSLFRVVEQLGGSFILILPFALCVGPILAFYNMNIKRRDFLRSAIIGCIAYVICLFMLDAIYFTYMGFTPYSRLYTCEFTTRKFLSITSNLTGGVIGGIAYALLAQAVLRRMGAAAGYTKLFDSDVSKWYGIAAALFVTYYTMYFFIGEYRTVTPIRGSFAWNDLMIDMRQRGSEPQFLATSDLITLTQDLTIPAKKEGPSIRELLYQKWGHIPEERVKLEEMVKEFELPPSETRITCMDARGGPCKLRVYNTTNGKVEGSTDQGNVPVVSVENLGKALAANKRAMEQAQEVVEVDAIAVPKGYSISFVRGSTEKRGVQISTVGGTAIMRTDRTKWSWAQAFHGEFEALPSLEQAPGVITLVSEWSIKTRFDDVIGFVVFKNKNAAEKKGPNGEAIQENHLVYGETEYGVRVPIIRKDNVAEWKWYGDDYYGGRIMLQPVGDGASRTLHIVDRSTGDREYTTDLILINPQIVLNDVPATRMLGKDVKGQITVGREVHDVAQRDDVLIKACGAPLTVKSDEADMITVRGETNIVRRNGIDLVQTTVESYPQLLPFLLTLASSIIAACIFFWRWFGRPQ